jgi:hypothetical protein
MDSLYLIRYLSKLEGIKDDKDDKDKKSTVENFDVNNMMSIGNIIALLIGGYAAYLSYTCNTRHNVDEPLKILYAVLAFFFGLFYLIYYVLFRSDYCHVENA